MGTGSVAATGTPRNWQLKAKYRKQTQGLIVSPFSHLPAAAALFLRLPDGAGGAWLKSLRERIEISDASGRKRSAAAIAFTWSGLGVMGLDDDALASFSIAFREGMHQSDRRRRLGDNIEDAVVKHGPLWSANIKDEDHDPDPDEKNLAKETKITVHAVLLLYAEDEAALDGDVARAKAALDSYQVSVPHCLRLPLVADADGKNREHFGFADGMSQPVPVGDEIEPPVGPESEAQRNWHGVAVGEILIGYKNAHGELAPGPRVKEKLAPSLPPLVEGFRDLGMNGSYMVIRELHQDVAEFWRSMDEAAKAIGDPTIDGEWVAARVVGRTRAGDPLTPTGTLPPVGKEPATNFGFADRDLYGFGCPLGAHIRRANPRDSLPSRDGPREDLLESAKSHRILRRGRKFGPPVADPRIPDGATRGLLFMCFNTDLARQFEFIQQTWMLNPSFATLFHETDPLVGPKGRFTIPRTPLRYCPEVQTFIKFAGGEYFFLPSIPALDYLGTLGLGIRYEADS